MKYDHVETEKKWPKKWAEMENNTTSNAPKFFMHFAYPGISGYQHVGHMRGFSYTDIICRYKRMKGFNVFFPLGTHATGNQALGFAKKVEKKDEKWLNYLKENGYPMKEINKMKNVDYVVNYFNQNYQDNWKRFGFIADFNSFTCTVHPEYKKFIDWQFRKLNELGLLIQKPYYATFCPHCGPVAVDASETDISSGGNAEKQEFTLLKFSFGNEFIVAATLRPETVFGQTNLWADPNQEYVKIKIENETWICSPQCAEKLSHQKNKIEVTGKIKGKDLINKTVIAPGINREIPILPSKFVNAAVGTGLVTSVPSDAPYDWMALHDLQKQGKYTDIQIIPIINSKGLGDTPALKLCEQMQITNQNDPKLEQATKEIYRSGFHTGVMNEKCGEYAGLPVEKAKEQVKQWLIDTNKANTMYDLSEEVTCRCGEQVLVKLIPDAWFIKYGDEKLTKKAKTHTKSMKILPPRYKENIEGILDWFQERACARLGSWLGTPLPFDNKWTIEPISDSTLYPAFYVVSRFVNSGELSIDDLTEEFFDYVYLAKGKPKNKTWEKIKTEFDYWYPVDLNLGGKEHQTVHFPVYIMNHVAILPKDKWPKGIFVNYWIMGKGGKISKSKGGASASPQEAAKQFSVDGLRLYYSHVSSPHTDVDWDEDTAFSYKNHVEAIYYLIEKFSSFKAPSSVMDDWLVSRFNTRLKQYTSSMDEYDLRTAIGSMLFDFQRELIWYEKRGGNSKKALEVIKNWVKCLTPFTPFVAEECWSKLGQGLASEQSLPKVNNQAINQEVELSEEVVRSTEQDITSVLKLVKVEPKMITLIVAPEWKRTAWTKARNLDRKTVMSELMKMPELKSKEGAAFAGLLQKRFHELGNILSLKTEQKALETALPYLEEKFGYKTKLVLASEFNHAKTKNAVPGKPAILVE